MLHALHGNFGSPADWAPALPPEPPSRRWNLWQIRRQHPEARTLTGFAHWLNHQAAAGFQTSAPAPAPAFASAPSAGPNILAGYSLGGRLALTTLALAPPGLWQAAILLAPHPGLPHPAERAARLIHDQTWAARCRQTPWPDLLAAWNAQAILAGSPPPSPPDESWRPEIATAFEDWSLGQQPGLLPQLPRISTPILWLTGAGDPKFTTLAIQAAQSASPGRIDHQILPRCGHRLLQQAPSEIHDRIRQFLRELRVEC